MDNKKHGHGVWKDSNGRVYEGEFLNDNFHGKGKLTYITGEVFIGEFVNDYSIRGIMTLKNGKSAPGTFPKNTYCWNGVDKFVPDSKFK